MTHKINVCSLDQEITLEKFLKKNTQLPYSMLQKLLRKKLILIDGKKAKSDSLVSNGQSIEIKANIELSEQAPKNIDMQSVEYKKFISRLEQNIILQDQHIIAFDKPPGMAVQGGTKIKISIDDALESFQLEKNSRPKLVHRLDKETSGVLIVARTSEIAEILARMFKEKDIEKTYIALLNGKLTKKSDTVNIDIESDSGPKKATTKFSVIKNYGNKFSLVKFNPITGRKHQLRITAQHLGHPILGDRKYGIKSAEKLPTNNLFLHCAKMEFFLKDKKYTLEAKLPKYFDELQS